LPLPLRTKLLFASSHIGSDALSRSRALWLLYFYAPPSDAHLPTILPGLAFAIIFAAGSVLGSLDLVLVGYFSDKTRSRWGRRIPYVVAGAPLWALFAFLLFTPPSHSGTALAAVYFFCVFELFFLFQTVSGAPYEALLPELAPTSAERVSLQSYKVYFGVVGTTLGLVGSYVLKDQVGFKWMALTMAGLALIFRYVGIFGVWGRAKQSRIPAELTFREALGATFRNIPFRILLPSVVLFAIAFDLLQAVIPFYAHAMLPKGSWLTGRWLVAIAIAAAVVCVPLFKRFAARTSKRHAYRFSMLAAALAFPLLAVAGVIPGIPDAVQIAIAVAIIGAPIGAHYLFPIPLYADVIDQDSGRTKQRREATYLGAQGFVETTATSIALPVLVLLRLLGDTRGHSLGVRLVGPVGGLIVFAGWLLFRAYRLPDDVRDRVPPQAATPGELPVGEPAVGSPA
jgi:glycoside/pentoside/hexuronide:cation symporter, GPH family